MASEPDGAPRVFVLHERPAVVDLVVSTLVVGGFAVRAAGHAAGAEEALQAWQPQMAVLDMDDPAVGALLRRFTASNNNVRSGTPILGLTSRADLAGRLRAFDLGVDDILTVPFSPDELLARAVVMTRRTSAGDAAVVAVIRIDDTEVDLVNREVRAGGSVTRLTHIEERLLSVFASRGGEVVSRDELVQAVWGMNFMFESNIVDRHVRSLRIKLRDDFRRPRFVATVHGVGYRFLPEFSAEGWRGATGGDGADPAGS